MGGWVAGCDICQEVCPFNTKAVRQELVLGAAVELGAQTLSEWKALLGEDEAAYRARVRDSALSRVKPAQFRRNLAIAIANSVNVSPRRELLPLVRARLESETDEAARIEWERCVEALGRAGD